MEEEPGAGGGRRGEAHGRYSSRFGRVTQGTAQVLPLQASKTACGPENRQEAGGGRDVEVTGYKEHSQWEVGWVLSAILTL